MPRNISVAGLLIKGKEPRPSEIQWYHSSIFLKLRGRNACAISRKHRFHHNTYRLGEESST
jgi:hypothetical protein